MKNFTAGVIFGTCRIALLAAGLSAGPVCLADDAQTASPESFDFAKPKLLTATIYEIGSDRKKVLYTFRRTAIRSGSTVNVTRQFLGTNGSVAAVENVVYESGKLVSLQMREFQAQLTGSVQIAPDPKNPDRQKLVISFGSDSSPPKSDSEKLPPDTVIDDNLYPFMLAHWDDLMQGRPVKFHFVSLEWRRTFEFRFVKTAESVQNGETVEQIKMEPVNVFVSELVNPLLFTVEKDSPHRILSYIGRTTPRIKKGKSWKYLDAETVFDWQ